MGLWRPDPLRRRARLLPPASSARQDASSSAARAGQSTRRDPPRLPRSPADLPRRHRLADVADGCRLTFSAVGCLECPHLDELEIDKRYEGIPGVTLGGYLAGLVAKKLGPSVAVTLSKAVPPGSTVTF